MGGEAGGGRVVMGQGGTGELITAIKPETWPSNLQQMVCSRG